MQAHCTAVAKQRKIRCLTFIGKIIHKPIELTRTLGIIEYIIAFVLPAKIGEHCVSAYQRTTAQFFLVFFCYLRRSAARSQTLGTNFLKSMRCDQPCFLKVWSTCFIPWDEANRLIVRKIRNFLAGIQGITAQTFSRMSRHKFNRSSP